MARLARNARVRVAIEDRRVTGDAGPLLVVRIGLADGRRVPGCLLVLELVEGLRVRVFLVPGLLPVVVVTRDAPVRPDGLRSGPGSAGSDHEQENRRRSGGPGCRPNTVPHPTRRLTDPAAAETS